MSKKRNCCVPGCQDKIVRRFSLPTNVERRNIWIERIGNDRLLTVPDSNILKYVICANHFHDACFDAGGKLLKFALPTLNLQGFKDAATKENSFLRQPPVPRYIIPTKLKEALEAVSSTSALTDEGPVGPVNIPSKAYRNKKRFFETSEKMSYIHEDMEIPYAQCVATSSLEGGRLNVNSDSESIGRIEFVSVDTPVNTGQALLPIVKKIPNPIETPNSEANVAKLCDCDAKFRLCTCKKDIFLPPQNTTSEQILVELEASNPNITVVHEEEVNASEVEDQVWDNATEEHKPLNITLSKNLFAEPTSLPNKTALLFQKPKVPNLVNSENKRDVHRDSVTSETGSTLGIGIDDDLQSEVASTIDLCGDPLELDNICICCLKVTNVSSLHRSFVGSVSVLTLYEAISEIKVNEEEVPAMICPKCMRLLSRIDDFVKMLNHSYKVFSEAANSIHRLETLEEDPESYNLKKNEIIHTALKQKGRIPLDDDMFQFIGRRTQTRSNTSHEAQVDQLSSAKQNNPIQMFQRKRFRGRVHRYKVYNSQGRVTVLRADELQKKRLRKNTVAGTNGQDDTTYRDYCPFCCKRVPLLARHLRYTHSVDWILSRCLKCSFHDKVPEKLIEHCKSCGITPKKEPDVAISEMSIPDVNWYDESENKIDIESTQIIADDISLSEIKEEKIDVDKVLNNLFINKKKNILVCNKCDDFSSVEFDKIKEHIMDVHYNEKTCILCKKQYRRFKAMLYHVITFHGKRKCCKICLISFNNDQEIEEHQKSELHCTCEFCGRQYQNRRQLYKHWRVHKPTAKKKTGPAKCPECSREYASRQGVRKHMATFHKNIRYLCDSCGRSYTTNRALQLHTQVVHQGMRSVSVYKTYICETCGVDLRNKSRYKLEVHKAQHAGHNFVCRRCYASFPTKDLHEQHINELNHRLFECQICGATFVVLDAFKLHVENHGNSKSTETKGWKCRYCPKILKTKLILTNHEKLHTGERAYQCPECNQAFVTLGNMKKHRVLHYKPGGITPRKLFQEKTNVQQIGYMDYEENMRFTYKVPKMPKKKSS